MTESWISRDSRCRSDNAPAVRSAAASSSCVRSRSSSSRCRRSASLSSARYVATASTARQIGPATTVGSKWSLIRSVAAIRPTIKTPTTTNGVPEGQDPQCGERQHHHTPAETRRDGHQHQPENAHRRQPGGMQGRGQRPPGQISGQQGRRPGEHECGQVVHAVVDDVPGGRREHQHGHHAVHQQPGRPGLRRAGLSIVRDGSAFGPRHQRAPTLLPIHDGKPVLQPVTVCRGAPSSVRMVLRPDHRPDTTIRSADPPAVREERHWADPSSSAAHTCRRRIEPKENG